MHQLDILILDLKQESIQIECLLNFFYLIKFCEKYIYTSVFIYFKNFNKLLRYSYFFKKFLIQVYHHNFLFIYFFGSLKTHEKFIKL